MSHPNTDPPPNGGDPSPIPPGSDPSSQPTPTPSTPPTPARPDPRTDPAYITLLEGTLAEQNRRIAELERSNAAPAPTPAPAPTRTKEESRNAFFDDPTEASRAVVREELAATVGAVNEMLEFVRSTRGATQTDLLVD